MLLVIQLSFKIFYVIDYIRDSYRCVFTISCLSSRSARDFCSCFERFEYFGGFAYPISSLISLFVASINVLIVWWFFWEIHVLSVGFLGMSFSTFTLLVCCLKCPLSLILDKNHLFCYNIYFFKTILH